MSSSLLLFCSIGLFCVVESCLCSGVFVLLLWFCVVLECVSVSCSLVSGLGGMPILAMYESIRGLHVLIHVLLLLWSLASDIQLSPSMSIKILSQVVICPPLLCIGLSGILFRLLLLIFPSCQSTTYGYGDD